MIKHFCDRCGTEITEENECRHRGGLTAPEQVGRLSGEWGVVAFCVMTGNAKTKTWNGGDFCKYCVIDAINSMDDRPTQA